MVPAFPAALWTLHNGGHLPLMNGYVDIIISKGHLWGCFSSDMPAIHTDVMYGSAVCKQILGLSRGRVLYIYIYVGALQYTMLIFGFPFLWVLARIKKDTM